MNILLQLFRPLINSEVETRLKAIQDKEEVDYREAQNKTKAPIEKAFKSGGVQYYKLKDLFNQTCKRSFAAISHFEELRMKCNREFLVKHLDKQKEINEGILNSLSGADGKINLQIAFTLLAESVRFDNHLRERLELIYEPDTIMKLASIVFFDSKEDVLDYDYGYGIEKVNRWKKEGVNGFFLSKHMMDLVDYSSISEEDFQQYTEVADLINQVHLEALSSPLLTSKSMNG